MKSCTKQSIVDGEIKATPSKSLMIRAVVAALLSDGITTIYNPSYCDDANASLGAAEAFGCEIEKYDDKVIIKNNFKPIKEVINCRESGLCARMFIAIAALRSEIIKINGQGSLLKRPMAEICKTLLGLGVKCKSNNTYLPFEIQGPIIGSKITIDGSSSSQFLSGLLMALPTITTDTIIKIDNLTSKPYIDLTINLLKKFGIEIENNNYKQILIRGNQKYESKDYLVEGDWSGAAFILTAAAISGKVKLKGLSIGSYQADKKILDVLELVGAKIIIDKNSIIIEKDKLNSFDFDATDSPDLFPALVVLASNCTGISRIKGTKRLIFKESNRMKTLYDEFNNIGGKINIEDDFMLVEGRRIAGGNAYSHDDHRIAMALSIAGLNSEFPVKIDKVECIDKSYPNFYKDLKIIGGIVE